MDEYVPTKIPMSIQSAKSFNTGPPMKNRISVVMSVTPPVSTVRLSVSFTETFMIEAMEPVFSALMFSRMRSNTTMVSFTEYPAMVKIAPTETRESSRPSSAKTPMVMATSWMSATSAPMANENSNRMVR